MTLKHVNENQRTSFKSICISTNLTHAFIFMNLMRLDGPAHGIVTKTVHNSTRGGGGVQCLSQAQRGWCGGGGSNDCLI